MGRETMLNFVQIDKNNRKNCIINVEQAFNQLVELGEKFDKPIYNKVMHQIDGVISRDDQLIHTKYGDTHISKLSTGCKAVMMCIKFANTNKIVNISECGQNALNLLADIQMHNKSIEMNVFAYRGMDIINDKIVCRYNGRIIRSGSELYREVCGWNE